MINIRLKIDKINTPVATNLADTSLISSGNVKKSLTLFISNP